MTRFVFRLVVLTGLPLHELTALSMQQLRALEREVRGVRAEERFEGLHVAAAAAAVPWGGGKAAKRIADALMKEIRGTDG